jgi:pyruvate dehydrogenase E2 component (dihydrolipoamide acetyltransferase)
VTLTTTADATNMVGLRQQFEAARAEIVPAYTDFVACLVVTVLKRHHAIAVRRGADGLSFTQPSDDQYHIGIAVNTSDGLLVPVIQDVGRKSLMHVARESKAFAERARAGRLTTAEMQGGIFTITNLGAFGIDAFTPIINYPEVAILGLGAIRLEPVVMPDQRVVPRQRMTLSLTFDHAAMDGAPAAAFLRDVASAIENVAAHLIC